MIQLTVTVDIDNATRSLDQIRPALAATHDDVVNRIGDAVINGLAFTPPRRRWPQDYPIEWTSERQRRAYFATNGFGAGIPYSRTGRLQDGWRLTKNEFDVVFENPSRIGKFVFGTFDIPEADALRAMQRFHAITGWKPVYTTAQTWFAVYEREIRRGFANYLDGQP